MENQGCFKKGQVSAFKGRKHTEEWKRQKSMQMKGKIMHPNTKKALLKTLWGNSRTLGKKMSKEFCEKVRQRMTGNKINLGRKHTEEHKNKMSEKLRGEKAPNWKGGITPFNQQIRRSRKYRKWEQNVFDRDGGRCKKCQSGDKLTAHHILNFSTYPLLRFEIENGVSLCRRCHYWFHHTYGRKNNNQKQLQEFLKSKNENRQQRNKGIEK